MHVTDLTVKEDFKKWEAVLTLKDDERILGVVRVPPEQLRAWGNALLNAAHAFDVERTTGRFQ